MRLPGYLTAFVLTVLLASTTPVGTGAGVHQYDLLHPLFSHMHVFNGRLMTHEQMEVEMAASPAPAPGVAFGSGGGAGSDDGSIGISPTLPNPPAWFAWPGAAAWDLLDLGAPAGREVPPPDPPPL
jgi:hypothetical protein